MNALLKTMILSAAVVATTVASIGPASARDHHGDDLAIGAAGLAAGVLLGGALASRPRYVEPGPVYVDPDPVYVEPDYYEPAPVYRARPRVIIEERRYYRPTPVVRQLRPWSNSWMRYCANRYQSFDRSTGTYIGYDGREHFCTAG